MTITSSLNEAITSEYPCGDMEKGSDLFQNHEVNRTEKNPTVTDRGPTSLGKISLPEDSQIRDRLGYGPKTETEVVYSTTTMVVYQTKTVEMVYQTKTVEVVYQTKTAEVVYQTETVEVIYLTKTATVEAIVTTAPELYQFSTVVPIVKLITKLSGTLSYQEATTVPVMQPSSYPALVDTISSTNSKTTVVTGTQTSDTTLGLTTTLPITVTLEPSSIRLYHLPTGNYTSTPIIHSIPVSPTGDPSGTTVVPVRLQKTRESSSSLDYSPTLATDYPSVTESVTLHSTKESGTSLDHIPTTPTTAADNNSANTTPLFLSNLIPTITPNAPQIQIPTAIMSEGSLNVDQFGDYIATELGETTTATGTPKTVACIECGEAMESNAGRLGVHIGRTSLWIMGMTSLGGLVMLW